MTQTPIPTRTVAIQVAMKEEGQGLVQKLGLEEIDLLDAYLGFRHFRGSFGEHLNMHLFLQGTDDRHGVEQIGLEAAAVCTSLIIREFKPDVLINFGTAGAFANSGLKIADVLLIEGPVKFHDRRVPMPGYFESQEGNHGLSCSIQLRDHLKIKTAKVSSGSSLEMSTRDHEMLISHGPVLKEMELAAIAWVCEKMNTPLIALKSVTDFIDAHEASSDQFLKNLAQASAAVQVVTIRCLEFLDRDFDRCLESKLEA